MNLHFQTTIFGYLNRGAGLFPLCLPVIDDMVSL